MAEPPVVASVEEGDEYVHVRYDTDAEQGTRGRTANTDGPIHTGVEVRLRNTGEEGWTVQRVLIPVDVGGGDEAVRIARQVAERFRERSGSATDLQGTEPTENDDPAERTNGFATDYAEMRRTIRALNRASPPSVTSLDPFD